MILQSNELKVLLRSRAAFNSFDPSADASGIAPKSDYDNDISNGRTCDVSFVIFLEPPNHDDPSWSTAEWLVDRAIRTFSPAPTMSHVELVVPPIPNSSGGKTHFATYLGSAGANWQNKNDALSEGIDFYLIQNGARWRCIPVFAPAVSETLRAACDANLHSPYSLSMYPTSARPFRRFAWLWNDEQKHKGHCATLTTRVLKEAGAGYALPEHSAWYCPSSLYKALNSGLSARLNESERANMDSVGTEVCSDTIETLLHGPLSYKAVRDLGDAKCIDAIRALTLRVVAAADRQETDSTASRTAQKELANAVLRWVLLRADETVPD